MEIKIIEDSSKGYAIAYEQEKEAGRMTYSIASSALIIIDHTEVNPQFKGKAIGMKLLDAIVAMARQSHKQIFPLCPFANALFKKNKDIQDVLKK